jgi:putative transposase
MPRRIRHSPGGLAYHVMNRAAGRVRLFDDDADYAAFERVLAEAVDRFGMRLCAYCLMPNHWHLVLWPKGDDELSPFVQWLAMTHTLRWHAHRHTSGRGHLYQGRFKSFPAARDPHFLSLCRYVERNALRARLVDRAQDWQWSSLWRRSRRRAGGASSRVQDAGMKRDVPALCDWPVDRPADWLRRVNEPETAAELEAVRRSCRRGSPFGPQPWVEDLAGRMGLESTLRPPGRPKKNAAGILEPEPDSRDGSKGN